MNPIVASIILIIVAAVLYGIFVLVGRSWPGTPQVFVGIIELLILLLIALHLFGVYRFAKAKQEFDGYLVYRKTASSSASKMEF